MVRMRPLIPKTRPNNPNNSNFHPLFRMKTTDKLLTAISFSASAHRGQFRKDGETPYHAHPMRVATIVAGWGVDDEATLIAALLHDTIEDTTTDFDDIAELFGEDAAQITAALTKDSRLPYKEREDAYYATLAKADWRVRVVKMADGYDNLLDSMHAKVPVKALEKAKKAIALLSHEDGDESSIAKAREFLGHGKEASPLAQGRAALAALVAKTKARVAAK